MRALCFLGPSMLFWTATQGVFGQSNAVCPVRLITSELQKSGPKFIEASQFLQVLASTLDAKEADRLGGRKEVTAMVSRLLEFKLLAVGNVVDTKTPWITVQGFVNGCG